MVKNRQNFKRTIIFIYTKNDVIKINNNLGYFISKLRKNFELIKNIIKDILMIN